MKTLVLIDSNAIIHRAYHAIPASLSTRKGEQTNAVYGFTTTLIKVLEDLKPDFIAASFDVSKKTFRTEHYAEYKAHRKAADQELYDQMPRVRQLLEVLDIPIYEKENYEADDCIGTIVESCQKSKTIQQFNNLTIYIVTGDKDLFQLVNGNIKVYNLKKGLSQTEIVDREVIKKEYNLDPADFIDLKALAGDQSDNIPGIPGVGPKTATELLQKFDTLEKLYEQIDLKSQNSNLKIITDNSKLEEQIAKELGIKPRILKLLIEHKEQAFLSQRLATIHKEVPIEFKIEDCKWGEYDKDKVRKFFEELQFQSLLKRFSREELKDKKSEIAKKDEQLKLL